MKNTPKILESGYYIPPKPDTLTKIQNIQQSAEPDLVALSEIISQDVGLAAIVLKTINSSLYGARRQITDIKQSVMMLGLNFVSYLSTFHLLKESMPEKSCISLERFWESSAQVAFLTGVLIKHMNLKSNIPLEDAYAAGLFLDCGIPVMAFRYDDYHQTLVSANNQNGIFTDTEDERYRSNHAIVGYFVAKSWDLPEVVCEMLLGHHDHEYLASSLNSDRYKDLHGILKISENLLNKVKRGDYYLEWVRIRELIFNHFYLSEYEFQELEQDIIEEFSVAYG